MKVAEALRVIHEAPRDAAAFRVTLACGCTPLHLQTFLQAHLQLALPNLRVVIMTGLYGDLPGTLQKVHEQDPEAVAISLEWEDLDPRLGFRSSGRWGVNIPNDIVSNARSNLDRLANAISSIQSGIRVALAGPSLPLPPLFHTPGWRSASAQLTLQRDLAEFLARLAGGERVGIVNLQVLAEKSPAESRYALRSDLAAGLPYSLRHAEVVSSLLAQNIAPPAPKKGIITDLDDTLWSGIVGEVGPDGVSWDLASHSHLHGLYQKLLASLSNEGVLVGVASKNDPAVVERAFQRNDLLLTADLVFPTEVHWNAKSSSVTRILRTWNIAADSVVFVDDSPMELAEVATTHAGIETVLFPKDDVAQGLAMLYRLRDLCGKERLSQDDSIRLDSIRRASVFREQTGSIEAVPESFLQQLNSVITLDLLCAHSPRVFELINKTSQFNLNGIRYTEAEWRRLVLAENALLMSAAYEDKFGPLGTIAVLEGSVEGSRVVVNAWVMSCRAFARRIEHAMLQALFDYSTADEVEFCFSPTPRNGPLQEFLTNMFGSKPDRPCTLNRTQFERNCPQLYHEVRELRGAKANA